MKKLAIPAILAFWLVILGVAMVFMNRPDYPPHPPPPDIVAPGNVELVQANEGYALVRITTASGQSVEYSASDSTLLEYGGPIRGTPYHLLDAVPLGLVVDGVEWTKSGDLVVSAERDYVTLCDEEDPPELVLTQGEDGGWTTWLDRSRTVSVGEEGHARVEGLDGDVDGRYVGTMPRREFLAPTYVFDPDWTPAFQPTGPANASRLLLVRDTTTTEITGWPRWDPEGRGILTSDLPCGPTDGGGKGVG